MKKLIILACFISAMSTYGQTIIQCDSIKIYDSEFDRTFQNRYERINSDTVLAMRHCGSTNSCYNASGLLCWKSEGKYKFLKFQGKGSRITKKRRVSKRLREKLIEFFELRIYEKDGEIKSESPYWIDDGPATIFLFKTQKHCWRLSLGVIQSDDIRIKWGNEILRIMRRV